MKAIAPKLSVLIIPASLALLAAGCSNDDDAGGSGGTSVEILQPADGETVSVPFTFRVESSEELGPTDEGLHHIHVFFDGNDDTYEVIEEPADQEIELDTDSPALEGIGPGEHTLEVSLRNADHSAAGAEDQVEVTIEGGGAAGGSSGSGSSGSESEDSDGSEDTDDPGDTGDLPYDDD